MPLTKAQIQQIDTYIKNCGVQWYDVRMELIDHFALAVEENLEENQDLEFKQALNKVHKSFGVNGFKNLLATKTKVVEKQFYKSAFKYFVGFFKIPRIILTVSAYWGLVKLSEFFDIKKMLFYVFLSLVLYVLAKIIYRFIKSRNFKNESFLKLNQGIRYLHMIYTFLILINSFSLGLKSDINENSIYLIYSITGLYVLLTLFLISCEYVYYHLKQDIKNQFPNLKLAQ